ncbi:MAG: ferrous iron transport protein [Desulfobulbaceae bacterium]|jgi:ferrous iron transport protein A|nr:MAG: ferrous iron transport protein [Desulfobulbaceae bacterium]
MNLHLGSMTVGDRGIVTGYTKESRTYRARLLAMGLTRDTSFTVTRLAPLGDPVEIEVRGFALSLRREEAATIMVRREEMV